MELHALQHPRAQLRRVGLVVVGQYYVSDAKAFRGKYLLATPPIGRTLPCSVISPVIAYSVFIERPVSDEQRERER